MNQKLTYNRVQLIGHLGGDPELKYSTAGRAWTRARFAVHQGEDRPTMWLTVKAFARRNQDDGSFDESVPLALAECEKGQRVQLTGRLFYEEREYNGKEYRDWGIVLFMAPVDAPFEKNGDADSGDALEGEPA